MAFNGKPLAEGGARALGNGVILFPKRPGNRLVTIEQPSLTIRVVQLYAPGRGTYLPRLDVTVRVTRMPDAAVAGLLGDAFPPSATRDVTVE